MCSEEIRSMAARAGFNRLTDLQERSFDCRDFYDVNKWLFVLGATGSGKTLVALMSYFHEQKIAAAQGRSYRMLFAVPYRALASQKFDEITDIVNKLELHLRIVQSTSENLLDDADIIAGRVDIAVIINEKIFMFASRDNNFLSRYDLIVLDEVALNQDEVRGLKTDFVLLKAMNVAGLRLITLGTPFYDWREYVEKFRFTPIVELERPIEIRELLQFCKAGEKFSVRRRALTIDICRQHLERGEKILIFINNRGEVRDWSRALSRRLSACLKPWSEPSDCRDYILKNIQADSADILCGTMDDEDYRAFACGITYHNANMPSTLRYMIERDFLSVDGKLKIICSTETLAYGINSNADVVIIPRMRKDKEQRFLFPNEYMNYAGRAGRLNPNSVAQKTVGYVYPLMEFNQRAAWLDLQEKIRQPTRTYCRYLSIDGEYRAFYVLSLFAGSSGLTAIDVERALQRLPLTSELSADKISAIDEPLRKLLKSKLIRPIEEDDDDEPRYVLTDVGKKISGFVVMFDDFQSMLDDVRGYVTAENFFEVDMFDSVVNTIELSNRCDMLIGRQSPYGDHRSNFKKATIAMKKIFEIRRRDTSPKLFDRLTKEIARLEKISDVRQALADPSFKRLRMLAALAWWRHSTCNPTGLFGAFNIFYEQMRRLLEIVSYRLEMIDYGLEIAPGLGDKDLLRRELGLERLATVGQRIKTISDELLHQPSKEVCSMLGLEQCDFYRAQRLRAVEKIFSELSAIEREGKKLSPIERKKFVERIKHWRASHREAIMNRFATLLSD